MDNLYGLGLKIMYFYLAFDGILWPGRLLGFAMGMLTFAICANVFLGEGLNAKTITSLVLATVLTCIQIFWK